MRVFVTGAIGFVGQWLQRELLAHGHVVVPAPGPEVMDATDRAAVVRWLADPSGAPDAVVHLAGMAFAPDASHEPAEAFRVNLGGTITLFEALRELGIRPPVVVSGSSDVYGSPDAHDLPLREDSRLAPTSPYSLSKAAQEGAAVAAAARYGFRVVATRSFNHTGPGQRPVFVVPAMAQRVAAVKRGEAASIRCGNLDVRRDLTDVRDVVIAYRLLAEWAAETSSRPECTVVNIASGDSIAIRSIVERLCALAGVQANLETDQTLVRSDDPPEIRGDASLIKELVGWKASISLDRTLADLLAGYA